MDHKFISDSQYHELAMMNNSMVQSHNVKLAKSMSSCISVSTIDADSSVIEGAYRNVNDILDFLFTIPDFLNHGRMLPTQLTVSVLLEMVLELPGAKIQL